MSLIHLDFAWESSNSVDEVEIWVSNELLQDPDVWSIILIIRLSGDIIVLEISLSVESDLSSLDFSVLTIDLVSNQNNGDVITDSGKILIPLRDIFIGNSGGDIEHDDGSMSSNIISFSESSEFFLSSSIPDIQFNSTSVSEESNIGNFDSLGSDIFLLELSSQMSLDESGLSDSTISD